VPSLIALGIAKSRAVFGLTDHRINAQRQNDEISAVVKDGGEWSAACCINCAFRRRDPTGQKTR